MKKTTTSTGKLVEVPVSSELFLILYQMDLLKDISATLNAKGKRILRRGLANLDKKK